MSDSSRCIVIGAGIGGLSSAAHLRARGYDVQILEASDHVGGLAHNTSVGGYTFFRGPTIVMMPELWEQPFAVLQKKMVDYVDLRPIDVAYSMNFGDGTQITVPFGADAFVKEVRNQFGDNDANELAKYFLWLKELYELEMPNYMDRNFDRIIDIARPVSAAIKLVKLQALRGAEKLAAKYVSNEYLQKILTFQSMYVGVAPYDASGIFATIAFMDLVNGVYTVPGGVGGAAAGLARAVEEAGVEIHRNTPVASIDRDSSTGRVTGVRLDTGERLLADIVVSNVDARVTYERLLSPVTLPKRLQGAKYSPSCLLWHAGVRGELPVGVSEHNLYFGNSWRQSFEDIFSHRTAQRDPAILIDIPTVNDPSLAPEGGHVLYVLEPMPNLHSPIDWKSEKDYYVNRLKDRVAELGFPTLVDYEEIVTPLDWASQALPLGTPFSMAHTFFQTGPFRLNNIDKKIPGLIFAGGSTVPGVGVPMVLLSGRLAAQRADEYLR